MTTYTITIQYTNDYAMPTGEFRMFHGMTLAACKRIAKQECGSLVNWTKEKAVKAAPEAPKAWHYRGEVVEYIEERQLGWTLVFNSVSGKNVFAVTAELEYR